jgi:hypothetical protein
MARTISDSTQAVIANGTQISSPVMKYFFRADEVNCSRRSYLFHPDRAADCYSRHRPAYSHLP